MAKTRHGKPCKASVLQGTNLCAMHASPDRAVELGRKGGRANRHYVDADIINVDPPTSAEEVRRVLAQAIADVKMKKLDPRAAAAIARLASAHGQILKIIELQARLDKIEVIVKTVDQELRKRSVADQSMPNS